MTYIFTDKADEDLTKILSDGIDEYGTNSAITYYQTIIRKCEKAAENPFHCAVIEGVYPDCRRIASGAHSIFYRIDSNDIIIGRVLRTEMDFQRHI